MKVDFRSCEAADLVHEANRRGVRYHLPLAVSADNPAGMLMIWDHRDPAAQPLVEAMRARRDEVAAFLRAHRPPAPVIPEAELAFRRAVLREPDDDLPLAEMRAGMLRAFVVGIVYDVLDAERAAEEWARARAQADAEAKKGRPTRKRPPARRRTPPVPDRVVY